MIPGEVRSAGATTILVLFVQDWRAYCLESSGKVVLYDAHLVEAWWWKL